MRRPDLLRLYVWGFLLWWFVPIAVVVRTSLSSLDLPIPSGLSIRWYDELLRDEIIRGAARQSLVFAAATAVLALPLGTGIALWLRHARSRVAAVVVGILLVGLLAPQIVLGTALFILFTTGGPFADVPLGAGPQLLAHVTLALPFVVLIVWVRLTMIEREMEDTAADLGASNPSLLRRILLPLTAPALALAAVAAAVVSLENLVLSEWLCVRPSCRTVPMLLYRGGAGPPPMRSALATASSLVSLTMAAGVLLFILAGARTRGR